jgi:hypothetical protein
VPAHLGDRDPVKGRVELPVPGAAEPVTRHPPRYVDGRAFRTHGGYLSVNASGERRITRTTNRPLAGALETPWGRRTRGGPPAPFLVLSRGPGTPRSLARCPPQEQPGGP